MSHFLKYVKKRISRNKNFISAITGGTGSGKSYSALKLGEALDDDFDIGNVCFNPEEFMALVNGETKKLTKGSVIVFDEIQVSMGHLDFQNIVSKCLNYIFQTFRHRNFILIMTSPHFDFINASLRKLFHSRIETVGIDYSKEVCTLKPFLIQVSQRSGKVYNKYLRVNGTPVKRMGVPLPSAKLLKEYETKKDGFTKQLNKEIQETLQKARDKKARKNMSKANTDTVLDLWQKGKSEKEIAEKLNITERTVRRYKKKLREIQSDTILPKKGVFYGQIPKGLGQDKA